MPRLSLQIGLSSLFTKRCFSKSFISAQEIISGNRVALSRAITLVESFKDEDIQRAHKLLDDLSRTQLNHNTFRIGIAGPPGAGKSTFIESFGKHLLQIQENKVAVLAIDPSSSRTRGSILGDKTRMDTLSHNKRCFVRPSPTSGKLGGIAEHTSDVIELCESAGFNFILVETVGLGQNEVLIDEVVDFVIMLTPPQMGDELQGVKKGIMEIADMVVVNKADGPLKTIASHARTEYLHTFQLLRRKHRNWKPKVVATSAIHNEGISDAYDVCNDFKECRRIEILKRRRHQKSQLIWSSVQDKIMRSLRHDKQIQHMFASLNKQVSEGSLSSRAAANSIIEFALAPEIYRS